MIGYKAFNSHFQCRNKQYLPNTMYHENGNTPRKEGMMHFCRKPEDLFNFYPLYDEDGLTRFAKVSADNYISDGSICAANDLCIKDEMPVKEFISEILAYQSQRRFIIQQGYVYKEKSGNAATIVTKSDDDYSFLRCFVSVEKGKVDIWSFRDLIIVSAQNNSEITVCSHSDCVILASECTVHGDLRSTSQHLIVGINNEVKEMPDYRQIDERACDCVYWI